MGFIVENKAIEGEAKGDIYDYGNDFQALPLGEKRGILKTAKTLLKEQKRIKSLFANAENGPSPMDSERRKGP